MKELRESFVNLSLDFSSRPTSFRWSLLAKDMFAAISPPAHTIATPRTNFGDSEVAIYAWPSRVGVIILNTADAIDFEFLGLDPLDPPQNRLNDKKDEDDFCQRLLLLGAKWWDNEGRYSVIAEVEDGAHYTAKGCFGRAPQPPATMREKRFVKVAWPSTGGLWVVEFDTIYAGVDEEDKLLDESASRLQMARTMDERRDMLRDRFQAKFYLTLEDYKGFAFLNSWEENHNGEVGPLLHPHETVSLWKQTYLKNPK